LELLDFEVGGLIIINDSKIKQLAVEGAMGIEFIENEPSVCKPGTYEIMANMEMTIVIPFTIGNSR
jgi:hypothetical protein